MSRNPSSFPRTARSSSTRPAAAAAAGRADLPAGFHEALARRLREGARAVCFVGGGETAQLVEHRRARRRAARSRTASRATPWSSIPGPCSTSPSRDTSPSSPGPTAFSPRPSATACGRRHRPEDGTLEFLAKSVDGAPVAMVVRKGKGSITFLPSFGAKNVEVVDFILKDRLTPGRRDRRGARGRLDRRRGLRLSRASSPGRRAGKRRRSGSRWSWPTTTAR
ncbi:MAG: hypothetical protein MZV64_10990 [Ignavibacteriales bacterium]|nr:hypothetical protein [Ignavibacteriales bacterium]